jgi:hypothetical protein
MKGEGFTRRRGGAEGERDEVGFGVEDFQPRMGTNGEGMVRQSTCPLVSCVP